MRRKWRRKRDGFAAGGALGGFLGSTGKGTVRALLAPPGGSLYAAGDTPGSLCNDFAVAKVDVATGQLDSRFGAGGQVILDQANDIATWLAIDRNGELYVAGWSGPTEQGQCFSPPAPSAVIYRMGG